MWEVRLGRWEIYMAAYSRGQADGKKDRQIQRRKPHWYPGHKKETTELHYRLM